MQEAKQRFSALVERALAEGPQVVTRHGREVVVVAAEEYRRMRGDVPRLKDFLRGGPDLSTLDVERDRRPAPTVELAE